MMIGSKEHSTILESFEKNYKGERLDKEKNKDLWNKGIIYESGEINKLYQAYILGYSLGRLEYMN